MERIKEPTDTKSS